MSPSPATSDESLSEITPEGAFAGRTLSLVLVISGVVFVAASWDDLWRRCGEIAGRCVSRAAGAVLLTFLCLVAVAAGLMTWRRVGRRPVDAYGSSRYVWALGVLFALGAVLIAARIPAWTCARGRFDPVLELCLHPPTSSDATGWMLVKQAIVVVGLVGGGWIAISSRRVRMLAPLAVAAWAGGAAWLSADTLL